MAVVFDGKGDKTRLNAHRFLGPSLDRQMIRVRQIRQNDWYLFIPLILATLLFRAPAILNARAMSSDATIVGLQAQHILRGEWSRFLWGAGYQSSFDAYLATLVFIVAGANPWSLMVVSLIGHVILLACAFAVLRRRVGVEAAWFACLLLVFTPRAVNSVTVYPPRQWSITCLFIAVWLFDRASLTQRPDKMLGFAAFLSIVALYLDLFVLQMMVGIGLFALLCCWDPAYTHSAVDPAGLPSTLQKAELLRRLRGCAGGLAAGAVAFWLLRQGPESSVHTTSLAFHRVWPNLVLLWETCLPWLLGYKVFVEREVVWQAPLVFQVVQIAGAIFVILGIGVGGLAWVFRAVPWQVGRLGVLGALVAAGSLGGFAVSAMPIDQYSSRYLAPIIWGLPFALAPVCLMLGRQKFALVLTPYLLAAAVSGWLSFGPFVQGPLPVLAPRGAAVEESAVRRVLEQRGVHYAAADYWFAYRLTFMWNERIIVVPLEAWQDRYAPYRRAFNTASTVAFIFHPSQPQADPERYALQIQQGGRSFERVVVDDFLLLIVRR